MVNYVSAHLEKVHEKTWRQVLMHAARAGSETDKNQNIDRSRSVNNIYRGIVTPDAFLPFKKRVIDPLVKRKDQVLFGEITLTLTDDSVIHDKIHFLDACESFLTDFFGSDRWFGLALHADELAIHVHAFVIPILNGKLCSKEFFNSSSLRDMQDSFCDHLVSAGYRVKRGISDSGVRHDGQKFYSSMVNSALRKEQTNSNDLDGIVERVIRGKKRGFMQSMDDYQSELIDELKTALNEVFPGLIFAAAELKKFKAKFESMKKFNSKLAKKIGDERMDIFAPLIQKEIASVKPSVTMQLTAKPRGNNERLKKENQKGMQVDYRPRNP